MHLFSFWHLLHLNLQPLDAPEFYWIKYLFHQKCFLLEFISWLQWSVQYAHYWCSLVHLRGGRSQQEIKDGFRSCVTVVKDFREFHQGNFQDFSAERLKVNYSTHYCFAQLFRTSDLVLTEPSSSEGKCHFNPYPFFTLQQTKPRSKSYWGAYVVLLDFMRGWWRAVQETRGSG